MTGNIYQTPIFTLAIGEAQTINIVGLYLACIDATGSFSISVDDGPNGAFEAGMALSWPRPFQKVKITNTSGEENAVKLGVSTGKIRDARLTVPEAMMNSLATPDSGTNDGKAINSTGAIPPDLWPLANANADRRELIMENTSDTEFKFYFQDVYEGGVTLAVGEKAVLQYSGPVWGSQNSGSAKSISVASIGWNYPVGISGP